MTLIFKIKLMSPKCQGWVSLKSGPVCWSSSWLLSPSALLPPGWGWVDSLRWKSHSQSLPFLRVESSNHGPWRLLCCYAVRVFLLDLLYLLKMGVSHVSGFVLCALVCLRCWAEYMLKYNKNCNFKCGWGSLVNLLCISLNGLSLICEDRVFLFLRLLEAFV